LILGGISGAGITTFLESYRPIFIAVTCLLLGFAFYLAYRPRRPNVTPGRARMILVNKIMLWVVAVTSVILLCFPQAIALPVDSDDAFTSEMRRTVVQVEGMT
jgi:hypothetical protein